MPTIRRVGRRDLVLRGARICVREYSICYCEGNCTAPRPVPTIYIARRYRIRHNSGRTHLGSVLMERTFCYW